MKNEEVNSKNKKRFDMTNIKSFILDNKKIFIVSGVALLLVVIIIFGAVFLFGNNSLSTKGKYENILREMGKDFYENYYYERTGKSDEERKEFLSKYSTTGIKIDLENLARYNGESNKEKVADLVNPDNKNVCDAKNTRVIIIPKEGYKKTDYEIKLELDCGFEEEK